ncbi:MAG: delta-60 repeat domain-containing protein, partial [Actinomycetota bacterium]|nr:delta-60 repeat domain-containing protein [Actinomycetota bacterium]
MLCLAPAATASALPPEAPAAGAYTTDGPVQALAHAAGRTYIGGAFTRVGRRTGSGVLLSPAGATEPFPEVAGGDVHAAVSDENGGWYIGGTFTAVGGQPHVSLAHVLADGTVDPGFNPAVTDSGGLPAPVYALALSRPQADGERFLYVGGEFSRIGLRPVLEGRRNIAALRASNGAVNGAFATFTTCNFPPACQGEVRSLALAHVPVTNGPSQPVLFMGGDFTSVDTQQKQTTRPSIAALWGVGATGPDGAPRDGEVIVEWDLCPASGCLLREAGDQPDANNVTASIRAIELGEIAVTGCAAGGPPCSFLAVYVAGWRVTGTGTGSATAVAVQFRLNQNTRVADSA